MRLALPRRARNHSPAQKGRQGPEPEPRPREQKGGESARGRGDPLKVPSAL